MILMYPTRSPSASHYPRERLPSDYSLLAEDLEEQKIVPLVKEVGDKVISARIFDMIMRSRNESHRNHSTDSAKKFVDKSDRDGRLVAEVVAFRKDKVAIGETAVIVSSSPLLTKICRTAGLDTEGNPLILPISALAYLLSLVPGAHISLMGLRKLLFDTRFHEHVKPLERRALRVLHDSTQYSLPFARRAKLTRSINERMLKFCAEKGEAPRDFYEQLEVKSEETRSAFIRMVGESVDEIAISNSEKEIAQLKAENARLQAELKKRQNPR